MNNGIFIIGNGGVVFKKDEPKEKNFYLKGKFFETQEELFSYNKEWMNTSTDYQTFKQEWLHLGNDIFLNTEIRDLKITNAELQAMLHKVFVISMKEVFKESET